MTMFITKCIIASFYLSKTLWQIMSAGYLKHAQRLNIAKSSIWCFLMRHFPGSVAVSMILIKSSSGWSQQWQARDSMSTVCKWSSPTPLKGQESPLSSNQHNCCDKSTWLFLIKIIPWPKQPPALSQEITHM